MASLGALMREVDDEYKAVEVKIIDDELQEIAKELAALGKSWCDVVKIYSHPRE